MAAPMLGENWEHELCMLLPGWDGYKGKQISTLAIDTINSFSVVPCSHGGLQLEVHRDGFDIEVEIGPDGKIKSGLIILDGS